MSIIVGTIIGSGIFISPKGVLNYTGSVGLCLLVWVGSGLISLMGCLCYAELGTMLPQTGGEYVYLKTAFGDIPAFLFAWFNIMISKTSSFAIVTLTFATYAVSFFSMCGGPQLPVKLISAITIILVGIINSWSATLAARIQIIFTFAKVLALVVIIIGGFVKIAQGHTSVLSSGFEGTLNSPFVIALAFYQALWAYGGWQNLNMVAEEIKNPPRDIPRALVSSVIIVITLYVLTNISYLTVMTVDELLDSPAVAATWGEKVLGAAKMIIPLSVMVSTFGSTNGSAYVGGRLIFAAARDGFLPEVLSFLHVRKYTPIPSMILSITVALLMIIPGSISSLINFFSFTAWCFYGMTFASLLVMRYTKKDTPRPYKVPIVIPILMVFVSIYLVAAPIIYEPKIEFLYAFVFVMSGLLFYFPLVYYNLHFKCIDTITMYSQLLLEVSPPKSKEDKL
ncbi:b(0,+)-type amino acid transporter 1 isoform X1 [Patella vulgata]|uniref:b(0,+)-type amino acid transporter 1 isoform X1 n=2 Tax=Patella vulgata TaxID=6465 RepID=UPI0024A9A46A|nr:b(0,+)-type amino acid transporter 1 isoform X1 [Patella vulgata]